MLNTVLLKYNSNNADIKQKIAFRGLIEDIPKSELNQTDLVTLAKPLVQNTWLFRPGLAESINAVLKSFAKTLNPFAPTPAKPEKLFIYGCSDGHETYSIIMYLIKKYGSLEEAKKRVALHSIDIHSPGLEMAKSKKLEVYDDIYDGDEYSLKHIKLNLISPDKDIPKRVKSSGKINIKEDIFQYANFQEGRILEDFRPLGKFNEKNPVVVFFRNSLPYIKNEIALPFIDNLYEKLPAGSFFGIGTYDHYSNNLTVVNKIKDTFKAVPIPEYDGYKHEPFLFKKP